MKVKELRQKLQAALDKLEEFDDDSTVKMVSNTYFLDGARTFLGISGYDGGYINLADPVEDEEDEDWFDEDFGEKK